MLSTRAKYLTLKESQQEKQVDEEEDKNDQLPQIGEVIVGEKGSVTINRPAIMHTAQESKEIIGRITQWTKDGVVKG